jgi:hypothetical protein
MKLLQESLIKLLGKLLSPIIDDKGYFKLPKDKQIRFIMVLLFMFLCMLITLVYFETEGLIWKLPALVPNWL